MPSLGVAVAVEIVGLRLAWTTTLSVAVPVPPLPSLTVTVTVKVAAVANACVGFCSVETAVLSPKFHEYVSGSPSGSVPVAVKAIGTPTRVVRQQRRRTGGPADVGERRLRSGRRRTCRC
jgi:hypothetical protein